MPLLVAGCVVGTEPNWPALVPDPSWEAEYDWTWGRCGVLVHGAPNVRYAAIRWQVVPGTDRFLVGGDWVHAAWHRGTRTIILSEWAAGTSMGAEWIRRHEFLHAQAQAGHGPIFDWCERAFVADWLTGVTTSHAER